MDYKNQPMGFKIKQINNVYEKDLTERLKKLGITSSQCAVLDYLFHTDKEEVNQIDIEKNLNLKNPTVTGLLKRLDENGFDLVTDETGVFFECGYSDAKNWYELGKDIIRVSVDFIYRDTSDPEAGEILYYPGDFLIGAVPDYRFTPHNTTIRVENGQIIEMHRVYTP